MNSRLSGSLFATMLILALAAPAAASGRGADAGAAQDEAGAATSQQAFPPAPSSSAAAAPAPAPAGSAAPPSSAQPPAGASPTAPALQRTPGPATSAPAGFAPPPAASATAPRDQPPAASAQPPALPPPVKRGRTYTTRWYGWQVLIADNVSGAVFVGTAAGGETAAAIVSGAIFVTASPIIHFAHGHVGRGLASLGLHAGLPLAIGLLLSGGHPTSNCTGSLDEGCGGNALAFGFGVLIGMAGAMAIDTAALARDKVPAEPEVAIVPTLGPGRAGLALGGAF